MAWPTGGDIVVTNVDASTDDPNLARGDLLLMFPQHNDMKNARGGANGVASLDAGGKVPVGELLTNVANGIAGLDAGARVPPANLPRGLANGVASLDAATKVPAGQLPNASETTVGATEIATTAEVNAGTDDFRYVTPAKLNNWTGDSSIVTVGALTSGTWNANTIAVNKGGTGQTGYTNGQLLIGNTTGSTLVKATLSGGTGISIVNGAGSITINAFGTSAPTANTIMQRDVSGRAQVSTPSAAADIARKDTVDAHAALTSPHSSTSAATANRIILRDGSGRAQVATPSAAADIARKDYADGLGVSAPTASTIMRRDANGRAQVATPSAAADIARKDYVDAHGVVQQAYFSRGDSGSGSTQIPYDNTIPQINEGEQYMSLNITPKNAGNLLIIDVVAHLSHSSTAHMAAALFRSDITNAIGVGWMFSDIGGGGVNIVFRHRRLAGGTGLQTYNVRCGGDTAGTTYFNAAGGNQKYGGALASSITITEIKG